MPRKQSTPNKPRKQNTPNKPRKKQTPNTTPKPAVEEIVVSSSRAKKKKEKTVEEIYQKKSPVEHVLLRPDSYVGSLEALKEKRWVFDSEMQRLVYREITYVPGLYKIVDEILVNAADNKVRDDKMNLIKVDIDEEGGQISIFNNGKGIPIEMHNVGKSMYLNSSFRSFLHLLIMMIRKRKFPVVVMVSVLN